MSAPQIQYPPTSGGGGVSGSGIANTIPRWTGASTLGDSGITDNGTTVSFVGRDLASTAAQTWTLNTSLSLLSGVTGFFNAGTDGTYGDVIYIGAAAYPTTYRHRIKASVSATATNALMTFSLNSGTSSFTDVMTLRGDGNVSIGTATPATANSRLTVAGGFIVPAAGFGVYQAGDHLTLSGGAGKNVHLKPNDGGVLAVNVGSATCDMTAVAGYVLAVGGPVRATGTAASAPTFSTPGDTNTGMYFPAADTLRFATAGSPAVSITSGQVLQFDSGFGSVANAYGCRAWVNFNGTGVIAIRASGNVSSITDAAVGQYVVNFTSAMPDINYAAIGTKQNAATNADVSFYDCINAVASVPARTVNASGWLCLEGSAFVDSTNVNVAYFR